MTMHHPEYSAASIGTCVLCRRPYDDHQWVHLDGHWLRRPICVRPGEITANVKVAGGE